MPINSRSKGKRGERDLAKFLRERGFVDARRGMQFGKGSQDNPDVVGLPGHHIEVKWVEKLNVWAAYGQAKADADDKTPIVFFKRNGSQWMACVAAEDYLRALKCNEAS